MDIFLIFLLSIQIIALPVGGVFSINFMKYELNHRNLGKRLNEVKNMQKFYDKLKAQDSFIEPDFNKLDKIEGVFIPKKK